MRREFGSYAAQLTSMGGSALLAFGSAFLLGSQDRGELGAFLSFTAVFGYISTFGAGYRILNLAANENSVIGMGFIKSRALETALVATILSVFYAFTAIENYWQQLILGTGVTYLSAMFSQLSWYSFGRGHVTIPTALKGVPPLIAFFCGGVSDESSRLLAIEIGYGVGWLVAVVVLARNMGVRPSFLMGDRKTKLLGEISLKSGGLGSFLVQSGLLLLGRLPVMVGAFILPLEKVAALSIALAVAEIQLSFIQVANAGFSATMASSSHRKVTKQQYSKIVLGALLGSAVSLAATFVAHWFLEEKYPNVTLWILIFMLVVSTNILLVPASTLLLLKARTFLTSIVALAVLLTCSASTLAVTFLIDQIVVGLLAWGLGNLAISIAFLRFSQAKGQD